MSILGQKVYCTHFFTVVTNYVCFFEFTPFSCAIIVTMPIPKLFQLKFTTELHVNTVTVLLPCSFANDVSISPITHRCNQYTYWILDYNHSCHLSFPYVRFLFYIQVGWYQACNIHVVTADFQPIRPAYGRLAGIKLVTSQPKASNQRYITTNGIGNGINFRWFIETLLHVN